MKKEILIATLAIVAVAGCTGSTLIGQIGDDLLSVGLYRNGNVVPAQLSVVGGVEGITDIKLIATIINTGQLPLNCRIVDTTPSAFVKPTGTAWVAVGSNNKIESAMIPVAQFDGTTPNFWVKVSCDYTYANKSYTLTKEGSVSFAVTADPVAGFNLTFGSSAGIPSGGSTPNSTNTTCLSVGSGCLVNSACCSNSCPSTYIVYTTGVDVNGVGGTYAISCQDVDGCEFRIDCGTCDSYTCQAVYGTIPFGATSYTLVYQSSMAGAFGCSPSSNMRWSVVGQTGVCA